MRTNPIIRRLLAGLLLALFAFGGTPKKFLHDLVANHRDTKSRFSDLASHVQSSIFSCHTEDLVVLSPFIEEPAPMGIATPARPVTEYTDLTARLFVISFISTPLRGPPAFV